MSDDHANWIGSDLVAGLLVGPYDAEQDDGEVTLWFGEKPDAVSVTFNARGATFILSPGRAGYGVMRASWADILKVAAPLASGMDAAEGGRDRNGLDLSDDSPSA